MAVVGLEIAEGEPLDASRQILLGLRSGVFLRDYLAPCFVCATWTLGLFLGVLFAYRGMGYRLAPGRVRRSESRSGRAPLATALLCCAVVFPSLCMHDAASAQDADSVESHVRRAMRRAAEYFREQVASHGGYVYHYLPDLSRRWGEGEATIDQVWVQPPGTPTVGLAFLQAYAATGDGYYLAAAREAALALTAGQLRSGGWTNCIDFEVNGERVAQYRHGKGRGKNNSSLDDGQTSSALLLLIRADAALKFQDATIHEAAEFGLQRLLAAQFPNGAFPQVWDDQPNPKPPILKASLPAYDWRTQGRIKAYWDMYTLNDNVCGYVCETLIAAHQVYADQESLAALHRLGDFLLLAQLPAPQPAWAQQYNYQMQPIWARNFEPPAIAGDESQEAIETLMTIAAYTHNRRYLQPIPAALAYLQRSLLPDGRLARYYELKSNRPLYMRRDGREYILTYDDANLPDHYGWKTESRLDRLRKRYEKLNQGGLTEGLTRETSPSKEEVENVISELDDQGRWLSRFDGRRLVGQLKLPLGTEYLSSEQFSSNLTLLSRFLANRRP